MGISNMPTHTHSQTWTDSFADGCARYCESRKRDREWDAAMKITDAGQTRTSQTWDCSPWQQPTERANPDEETTNWRAVCGKTARTVRREGRTSVLLYPYHERRHPGGPSSSPTTFPSALFNTINSSRSAPNFSPLTAPPRSVSPTTWHHRLPGASGKPAGQTRAGGSRLPCGRTAGRRRGCVRVP